MFVLYMYYIVMQYDEFGLTTDNIRIILYTVCIDYLM